MSFRSQQGIGDLEGVPSFTTAWRSNITVIYLASAEFTSGSADPGGPSPATIGARWTPSTWFTSTPGPPRVLASGPDGLRVLCVSGVPGCVYEPPDWSSSGEP